jgi:hypothetical protein
MNIEDFVAAPIEQVRKVAPETLVWIVEGTRRSAALAGVEPASEDYPRWSIFRMAECLEIIFRHGVRHVLTPILSPSHFSEVTPRYRERLIDWVKLYTSDPEVVRAYGKWRLRLIGYGGLSELDSVAEQMKAMSPTESEGTVWIMVIPSAETLWDDVFAAMQRSGAANRAELIRACYGEDVAPATLLMSFGKPVISLDQIPPPLVGKMNCYWTQQPGYRLTERAFRTILFDAAYVRRTWRRDKTGRAEQAIGQRNAWEEGPVVGLGVRVGPFWYPAPTHFPDGVVGELPEWSPEAE